MSSLNSQKFQTSFLPIILNILSLEIFYESCLKNKMDWFGLLCCLPFPLDSGNSDYQENAWIVQKPEMWGSSTSQSRLLKEKYTEQEFPQITKWIRNHSPLEVPMIFNIHGMFCQVNIKYYYHMCVSKWDFHAISDPRLFLCNLISGTNSSVKIHPDLQSAKTLRCVKQSVRPWAMYIWGVAIKWGAGYVGVPFGIRLMTQRRGEMGAGLLNAQGVGRGKGSD